MKMFPELPVGKFLIPPSVVIIMVFQQVVPGKDYAVMDLSEKAVVQFRILFLHVVAEGLSRFGCGITEALVVIIVGITAGLAAGTAAGTATGLFAGTAASVQT